MKIHLQTSTILVGSLGPFQYKDSLLTVCHSYCKDKTDETVLSHHLNLIPGKMVLILKQAPGMNISFFITIFIWTRKEEEQIIWAIICCRYYRHRPAVSSMLGAGALRVYCRQYHTRNRQKWNIVISLAFFLQHITANTYELYIWFEQNIEKHSMRQYSSILQLI